MTKRKRTGQSTAHQQKIANMNTRGKNAAGQTNGQWAQDTKRRSGHFQGAGQAPNMHK